MHVCICVRAHVRAFVYVCVFVFGRVAVPISPPLVPLKHGFMLTHTSHTWVQHKPKHMHIYDRPYEWTYKISLPSTPHRVLFVLRLWHVSGVPLLNVHLRWDMLICRIGQNHIYTVGHNIYIDIYTVCQNHIYIQCIYSNFGREYTKYTVYIYGSGQPCSFAVNGFCLLTPQCVCVCVCVVNGTHTHKHCWPHSALSLPHCKTVFTTTLFPHHKHKKWCLRWV